MEQLDFGEEGRYVKLDHKKDPLVKLNAIIPWELFRPRLKKVWREPEGEGTSRRMSGSRSEIPVCAEAASGRHRLLCQDNVGRRQVLRRQEGAQAQYRRKGPGRYRIIKCPPPRGRLSRPSQCLSARQACIDTTRLPIPVGVSRSNSGR